MAESRNLQPPTSRTGAADDVKQNVCACRDMRERAAGEIKKQKRKNEGAAVEPVSAWLLHVCERAARDNANLPSNSIVINIYIIYIHMCIMAGNLLRVSRTILQIYRALCLFVTSRAGIRNRPHILSWFSRRCEIPSQFRLMCLQSLEPCLCIIGLGLRFFSEDS